jgi:hypothetical protein
MKRGKGIVPALTVMILLLCTAGCTTPSTPDAETKLCQDLAQLDLAFRNLEYLDPDSPIHELRIAQDQLTRAMEDVQTAADEVEQARTDDLEQSFTRLQKAMDDIPGNASPQEGMASIRDELAAFRLAYNQMGAEPHCSG